MSLTLTGLTDQAFLKRTEHSFLKMVTTWPNFDDVFIICPQEITGCAIPIKQGDFTYATYSPFILKNLTQYIDTDFCLVGQYDSGIINPDAWSNDFYDFDYIGAPWTNNFINRVGNGGFSLRSKKFLDLSAQLECNGVGITNNEDFVACVANYEFMVKNGVKFAPPELAVDFSVERPTPERFHDYNDLSTYKSFGFHGTFNTAAMKHLGLMSDERIQN